MRRLVGTHPCKKCGKPATVWSRAEIPHALCEHCGARVRAFSRFKLVERIAWANGDKGNAAARAKNETEMLREWLVCVAKMLEGSANRLDALPLYTKAERVHSMDVVLRRVRWAQKTLGTLRRLARAEADAAREALPLHAVDGGGEVPAVEMPPPELRLVPREGA